MFLCWGFQYYKIRPVNIRQFLSVPPEQKGYSTRSALSQLGMLKSVVRLSSSGQIFSEIKREILFRQPVAISTEDNHQRPHCVLVIGVIQNNFKDRNPEYRLVLRDELRKWNLELDEKGLGLTREAVLVVKSKPRASVYEAQQKVFYLQMSDGSQYPVHKIYLTKKGEVSVATATEDSLVSASADDASANPPMH